MSDAQANAPELILVLEAAPSARDVLKAAIEAVPPACLIIAPTGGLPDPDDVGLTPPTTAAFERSVAKNMIADCQAAGIAALLAEDADTAKALGADGVHLTCSDDLLARQDHARKTLGPAATVGVLCDMTRHTAMVAGEAGADYLAFDLRPGARPDGLDRVAWWAELFEIPSVALLGLDPQQASAAAQAGADFIALAPRLDETTSLTALLDAIGSIMSDARRA